MGSRRWVGHSEIQTASHGGRHSHLWRKVPQNCYWYGNARVDVVVFEDEFERERDAGNEVGEGSEAVLNGCDDHLDVLDDVGTGGGCSASCDSCCQKEDHAASIG